MPVTNLHIENRAARFAPAKNIKNFVLLSQKTSKLLHLLGKRNFYFGFMECIESKPCNAKVKKSNSLQREITDTLFVFFL